MVAMGEGPVMAGAMGAGAIETGAMGTGAMDMALVTEIMDGPDMGGPMLDDSIQMGPMAFQLAIVIALTGNSSGNQRTVVPTHIHTLEAIRQVVVMGQVVAIRRMGVKEVAHILSACCLAQTRHQCKSEK